MGQKNMDNGIPRRVYRVKGMSVVCLGGTLFASKLESGIVKGTAHVVKNDGGTITVTQRSPKKKGVSETWRKFSS